MKSLLEKRLPGILAVDVYKRQVHTDLGVRIGAVGAGLPGVLVEELVGRTLVAVEGDTEHALGGHVMAAEFDFPVSHAVPLRVFVEAGQRTVEGVGVTEASATDAASRNHEDVLERRHAQDAAQPDPGHPEIPAEVPGGLGEVLVLEAPSDLDHRHLVALFAEAQGRNTAAEPGTDDHPVIVKGHSHRLIDPRLNLRSNVFSGPRLEAHRVHPDRVVFTDQAETGASTTATFSGMLG